MMRSNYQSRPRHCRLVSCWCKRLVTFMLVGVVLLPTPMHGQRATPPAAPQASNAAERLVAEGYYCQAGQERHICLPIIIRGHKLTVILDLGTPDYLLVSRQVLFRLGILHDSRSVMVLDSIVIGTDTVSGKTTRVVGDFRAPDNPDVVGILGVQTRYDYVFDGRTQRVSIYMPAPTTDKPPPWMPPGFTSSNCVPMQLERDNRPQFDVMANGHRLHARFDSGAGTTVINLATARLLGLDTTDARVRLLPDSAWAEYVLHGEQKIKTWAVDSVTFAVGAQRVLATPIHLIDKLPEEDGKFGAYLGLDATRDHALFVSYTAKQQVCVASS